MDGWKKGWKKAGRGGRGGNETGKREGRQRLREGTRERKKGKGERGGKEREKEGKEEWEGREREKEGEGWIGGWVSDRQKEEWTDDGIEGWRAEGSCRLNGRIIVFDETEGVRAFRRAKTEKKITRWSYKREGVWQGYHVLSCLVGTVVYKRLVY